ncbi:uncharacterized protein SAPINGB_P004192 [Magnusiomyces paraingens]|uniref:Uncharacterized protein n=1 Tax=Magnusiomyces paraingens TaxID=2606893 RepID=A0A5E8BY79_9ASCO|nr:uncharacterized protein SAPINGB_P004192 [Saprochaete ingens]VVT54670.1 unnamed protein product [Saprochaete ingens]
MTSPTNFDTGMSQDSETHNSNNSVISSLEQEFEEKFPSFEHVENTGVNNDSDNWGTAISSPQNPQNNSSLSPSTPHTPPSLSSSSSSFSSPSDSSANGGIPESWKNVAPQSSEMDFMFGRPPLIRRDASLKTPTQRQYRFGTRPHEALPKSITSFQAPASPFRRHHAMTRPHEPFPFTSSFENNSNVNSPLRQSQLMAHLHNSLSPLGYNNNNNGILMPLPRLDQPSLVVHNEPPPAPAPSPEPRKTEVRIHSGFTRRSDERRGRPLREDELGNPLPEGYTLEQFLSERSELRCPFQEAWHNAESISDIGFAPGEFVSQQYPPVSMENVENKQEEKREENKQEEKKEKNNKVEKKEKNNKVEMKEKEEEQDSDENDDSIPILISNLVKCFERIFSEDDSDNEPVPFRESEENCDEKFVSLDDSEDEPNPINNIVKARRNFLSEGVDDDSEDNFEGDSNNDLDENSDVEPLPVASEAENFDDKFERLENSDTDDNNDNYMSLSESGQADGEEEEVESLWTISTFRTDMWSSSSYSSESDENDSSSNSSSEEGNGHDHSSSSDSDTRSDTDSGRSQMDSGGSTHYISSEPSSVPSSEVGSISENGEMNGETVLDTDEFSRGMNEEELIPLRIFPGFNLELLLSRTLMTPIMQQHFIFGEEFGVEHPFMKALTKAGKFVFAQSFTLPSNWRVVIEEVAVTVIEDMKERSMPKRWKRDNTKRLFYQTKGNIASQWFFVSVVAKELEEKYEYEDQEREREQKQQVKIKMQQSEAKKWSLNPMVVGHANVIVNELERREKKEHKDWCALNGLNRRRMTTYVTMPTVGILGQGLTRYPDLANCQDVRIKELSLELYWEDYPMVKEIEERRAAKEYEEEYGVAPGMYNAIWEQYERLGGVSDMEEVIKKKKKKEKYEDWRRPGRRRRDKLRRLFSWHRRTTRFDY